LRRDARIALPWENIFMVAVEQRRSAELRKKPRRQFHYHAKILTSETGPVRQCAIADISETGARLVLQVDEELPQRFMLLLSSRGEARRICRLVWCDGVTVGVEFPDGHS
jgi:hypothetical protein